MIIGSGLIAQSFKTRFSNDTDLIIFASGVSNSQERDEQAFDREHNLLNQFLSTSHKLVYFGTCSLDDPELAETPYVIHKKRMEDLVRTLKRYAIFRLPQVVGKTKNIHTLTNFFYQKITSNEHFNVWAKAKRNIIDAADVVEIVSFILQNSAYDNITVNVALPWAISMIELLHHFEAILGVKANCSILDVGSSYHIESSLTSYVANHIGISFDDAYIKKVIRKYYG